MFYLQKKGKSAPEKQKTSVMLKLFRMVGCLLESLQMTLAETFFGKTATWYR